MLTKQEIVAAPDILDATDIEMWLALFRANSQYKGNKQFYPDIEDVLTATNSTVKAKILNATLDKLEALGVGQISIVGGEEGLKYSQQAERDALVNYALGVLYDAVLVVPGTGDYSDYQVRQRPLGTCNLCGCRSYLGHICGSIFEDGYYRC